MKTVVILQTNDRDNTIKVRCAGQPFDGRVIRACTSNQYFKRRGGWPSTEEALDWTVQRENVTVDLRDLFEAMGYIVVLEHT